MMFSRKALSSLALATLGSLCLVSGCAHSTQDGIEAVNPSEEAEDASELAKLRRENERLQRQLRQTEERLRLARGGESASDDERRDAQAPSRRRSSSGGAPYGLPVVKVGPEGGDGTRATDAVSLGDLPNSGLDERYASNDAFGASGGAAGSAYDGGDDSDTSVADVLPAYDEDPPTTGDDGAVRSYRLMGSRLVQATREPPKQKQKAPPKTSKRSKRSSNGDPVLAEYEAAMGVYKAGRYKEAEIAFSGIVRNNADHDYADNALYWQGEAAYDQQNFADALTAFTAVVERYGGGNKAPDALLKIGLCYGKLGDHENARDVLTQLVAAYPRARATKIAKKRLADFSEG